MNRFTWMILVLMACTSKEGPRDDARMSADDTALSADIDDTDDTDVAVELEPSVLEVVITTPFEGQEYSVLDGPILVTGAVFFLPSTEPPDEVVFVLNALVELGTTFTAGTGIAQTDLDVGSATGNHAVTLTVTRGELTVTDEVWFSVGLL